MTGLVMGGLLIAGFMFAPYESPEMPEHFGQIEYCGVWWDVDDYEQMMEERDAYLAEEQAEEQALIDAVRQAQERKEAVDYKTMIASRDWDADESEMLARIAMAEAEDQGVKGMALVVCVVLNRVWSDDFPDSIEDVIKEPGQFTAYENGRYDSVSPSSDAYSAVEKVMLGWDESEGALYFESTSNTSTWHKDNLTQLFKYKDHIFYTDGGDLK